MADASPDGSWSYIEFRGDVYRLFWSGSPTKCPSLEEFPTGCNAQQIRLSSVASQTWKHSTLLAYGASSCIREDSGQFPVIKLAHPDSDAREQLIHEFEMLTQMSYHSLPIPRFCPEPLIDHNGIYGYRMEKLKKLDFENLAHYHEGVRIALSRIHDAGFVIGDLHPGNVMLDEQDRLVFIDLAHAGRIGEKVPISVPLASYQSQVFHPESDLRRLAEFFLRD